MAKLVEREIGKDQNGRVLTAKIIEVEPYLWLEFIEKSSKKLPLNFVRYLTALYREKRGKNPTYIPSGGGELFRH